MVPAKPWQFCGDGLRAAAELAAAAQVVYGDNKALDSGVTRSKRRDGSARCENRVAAGRSSRRPLPASGRGGAPLRDPAMAGEAPHHGAGTAATSKLVAIRPIKQPPPHLARRPSIAPLAPEVPAGGPCRVSIKFDNDLSQAAIRRRQIPSHGSHAGERQALHHGMSDLGTGAVQRFLQGLDGALGAEVPRVQGHVPADGANRTRARSVAGATVRGSIAEAAPSRDASSGVRIAPQAQAPRPKSGRVVRYGDAMSAGAGTAGSGVVLAVQPRPPAWQRRQRSGLTRGGANAVPGVASKLRHKINSAVVGTVPRDSALVAAAARQRSALIARRK
jgi:hypothetical protein